MRLFCLSAVVLVVGCGAVRTDPRPQKKVDTNNHEYEDEKAESKVAVGGYKPMKFDMSSSGAASSNVMYTSGGSPGSAGGAMVATAGHPYPYAYEEKTPASTYVIPSYAEEQHHAGFGGYFGVPHKTSYLPGHKYQPPGVKFNQLHQ
jgi:hypothetical protein